MKITVMPNDIKHAWDRIKRIPKPKSPLTSSHVVALTAASDSKVSLSASDWQLYGISQCQCTVEDKQNKPIILDASQVSGIIAHTDDPLTIISIPGESTVTIKSPRFIAKLPTVDIDMFKPSISNPAKMAVESSSLVDAISVARFAAGEADKRYAVEMVALDFTQSPALALGFDTVNLAVVAIDERSECNCRGAIKMNVAAIGPLCAFLKKESGTLWMQWDSNNLCLYNNMAAVYVRLSEGHLPDLRQLCSKSAPRSFIKIRLEDFISAAQMASVASDMLSPEGSSLSIDATEHGLSIRAASSNGDSEANVAGVADVGFERFSTHLSAARLLKSLDRFNSVEVDFGISPDGNAVYFSSEPITWALATVAVAFDRKEGDNENASETDGTP